MRGWRRDARHVEEARHFIVEVSIYSQGAGGLFSCSFLSSAVESAPDLVM